MAVGICSTIIPVDRTGNSERKPALTPQDEEATDFYFGMNPEVASPPQDQLDLKRDTERALFAIKKLYITQVSSDPPKFALDPKFRPYYVQLIDLARLGLRGPNALPEIAQRALENLAAELIDTEGGAVKNGHLAKLAQIGLLLAAPCLILYVLACLAPDYPRLMPLLVKLSIDPRQFGCFMMLWIGCFTGVTLSYGSRTTKMTLEDLIITDADYLYPLTRHLFAGTLTMILGLLLGFGVVEIKLAGVSSRQVLEDPAVAFLIGALCGISELLLPGTVYRKAGEVLGLKASTSSG